MTTYRVRWEIDITGADSPLEAAREAWAAMRRPDSIANVFDVFVGQSDALEHVEHVDLEEDR